MHTFRSIFDFLTNHSFEPDFNESVHILNLTFLINHLQLLELNQMNNHLKLLTHLDQFYITFMALLHSF